MRTASKVVEDDSSTPFGSGTGQQQKSTFGGGASTFGSSNKSTLDSKPLDVFGAVATSPTPAPAAGGDVTSQKGTGNPSWQETRKDRMTGPGKTSVNMLMSISAMKEYEGRSHEELRLEDYLQNRRNISAMSTANKGFGTTSAPLTESLFGRFGITAHAARKPLNFTSISTSAAPAPPAFGETFGLSTTPAPATGGFTGFGTPRTTAPVTGLFGTPAPAPTPAFGAAPPVPSGGFSFGPSTTAAPAPTSGFGGLFGGTSAPAPTPAIFGAGTPAPGGNIFGATSAAPPSFASSTASTIVGTFGALAPAPTVGGGGTFGWSTAPGSSAFGALAPAPAAGGEVGTGGSLFGSTTPPAPGGVSFFQPAPAPAFFTGGGAFSITPAPKPTAGAFGTPAPSMGIFGSVAPAAATPGSSIFGAPTPTPANTGLGGFGGGVGISAPAPAPSSVIGAPAPASTTGGLIGTQQQQQQQRRVAVHNQNPYGASGNAGFGSGALEQKIKGVENSSNQLSIGFEREGNLSGVGASGQSRSSGQTQPVAGIQRLERDPWSMVKRLRQATNESAPAPAPSRDLPSELFGSAPTPAPGVFGAVTPAAGLGTFGSTSSNLFSKPVSSPFGTSAAAAPATGGVFGAVSPAPVPTGGGLFGAAPVPVTGAFGAPPPAAGGGLFGSTTSAFGTGTTAFGVTSQKGTGNPSWRETKIDEMTGPGKTSVSMLMSISAMKEYEGRSHEELRLEDYLQNSKNGSSVSTANEDFGTIPAPLNGSLFGGCGKTPAPAPAAGKPLNFTSMSTSAAPAPPAFGGTFGFSPTPAPATGGFTAPATGLFGTLAPAPTPAFGAAPPAPSGGFSFGPSTTAAPAPISGFGGLFSTTPAPVLTHAIFGAAVPAPGAMFFGATSAAPPSFASSTASTIVGTFGALAPAPTVGGGGSFGLSTAPGSSAFGALAPAPAPAPAAGGEVGTGGSLFGSTAFPAPGGVSFFQPAPAPAFSTGGGAFSITPAPKPTAGAFGTPAPSMGTFGSVAPAAATPGSSIFGAPTPTPANTGLGGFGSGVGISAPAPAPSSVIGAPAPASTTGGLFGTQQQQQQQQQLVAVFACLLV